MRATAQSGAGSDGAGISRSWSGESGPTNARGERSDSSLVTASRGRSLPITSARMRSPGGTGFGERALTARARGGLLYTWPIRNASRAWAEPERAARRAAGRRSQEEAERTRTRILDRAERLFSQRGYRGVSVRELSRACGVQPFTIQHHFGSKPGLYQAVLSRWDEEILARVGAVRREPRPTSPTTVEKVVEELFDFFLEKRGWVALSVRAALGEGLAKGVSLKEQSWVQFIDQSLADQKLGPTQARPGPPADHHRGHPAPPHPVDRALQEAVRQRSLRSAHPRAHQAAPAAGDPLAGRGGR